MSAASRLTSETVYSAASISPEENNKTETPESDVFGFFFPLIRSLKSEGCEVKLRNTAQSGWTRLAQCRLFQRHNNNALNRGQGRSSASLHFNGFISLLSLPARTRDSKETHCTQTSRSDKEIYWASNRSESFLSPPL